MVQGSHSLGVPMLRSLSLVALVAVTTACHEPKSIMVHRPDNAAADQHVTQMWTREIASVARDGDWILSRSYFIGGDAITALTGGEDLSHASMIDVTHGTIIEAVGSGIREIPLSQLVGRNHYLIVVRPTGMTAADQKRALDRARTTVGGEFDATGLFGIDNEEKFYCSELVWWASETEARSGQHERIVTPADLMKYGEVLYWSGKRDDPQVMEIATDRATARSSYAAR